MAELIEPTHYDAVVISSGLPEVLLASALARAGKAVLVLDPADSYGTSWASLSGADFVHQLINKSALEHRQQQQQQQQPASQQPQDQAGVHERNGAAAPITVCQEQQPAGVQECSLYTHPGLEQALDNKGLIIDLAPRVLYQDEPLVQLLVSCQAHNYLEFKLVEGNYVYLNGLLQPVPASRADLFADRTLSLADKRSLGRFMAACVEAAEGSGRLQDAFDNRPLVDLLTAEGLNEQLQQVVLYGIAMADLPQTQQQPQQQASQQAGQHLNTQQQQQQQQQQQHSAVGSITAADGLAAFVLYSQSLGRYGGSGALMAPCYGAGSLTEAFVRLAAVKGAVTALRHGTQQIQPLGSAEPAAPSAPGGAHDSRAAAGTAAVQQPASAEAEGTEGDAAASSTGRVEGLTTGPVATAPARLQLTLSNGQTVTAGWVISNTAAVRGSTHSSSSSSSSCDSCRRLCVARAVAVLDGSLVESDTSLLFVIPPGSLGPWQTAVVRGLQLGHALAVAPPGHCLLYLSAVLPEGQPCSIDTQQAPPAVQVQAVAAAAAAAAAGTEASADSTATNAAGAAGVSQGSCFKMKSTAEQLLGPALVAVASTQALQQFAMPGAGDEDAQAAGSSQQSQEQQQQQHCASIDVQKKKPQVLAACFYTAWQDMPQDDLQPQQEPQLPPTSTPTPSCVASRYLLHCPEAPSAGFAGFTSSIAAAQHLFKQHFPDLPWLTEPLQQPPGSTAGAAADAGGEGEAATGQGPAAAADAGVDVDELDAIDELTAALMELSTGLESLPGQGAASTQQV